VDRLLALGRLDEAIAEAEWAGEYDLLMLADLFLRHGDTQRVEPVIVKRAETSQDGRLLEWLKQRYKERGELSEALALARQLMQTDPHLSNYQEVRGLSQQLGVWPDLRLNLLADLAAAKSYGLLTDIYLDEGEIDLALESVQQVKPNLFYGTDQMVGVAQAAEVTRPRTAIDIYLQRVASLIEARGRDNYQQACKYLARVRELYLDLHEDQVWEDCITELRERFRRLPALREELSKAGL